MVLSNRLSYEPFDILISQRYEGIFGYDIGIALFGLLYTGMDLGANLLHLGSDVLHLDLVLGLLGLMLIFGRLIFSFPLFGLG